MTNRSEMDRINLIIPHILNKVQAKILLPNSEVAQQTNKCPSQSKIINAYCGLTMFYISEAQLERLNAPLSRSMVLPKGTTDHSKFLTHQLSATRATHVFLKA